MVQAIMIERVMVLNGPSLNLLGTREPHIYGTATLAEIEADCTRHAAALKLQLAFHQSNHEGALIDLIHAARDEADAIVINPASYCFTSVAMLDALKAFDGPVIEVHLSNLSKREEFRHHSLVSRAATAVISGLGPYGYVAALLALAQMNG